MNRLTKAAVGTFGAAALAVATISSTAASPNPQAGAPSAAEQTATSPEVISAMARDFDLTPSEVEERLEKEEFAGDLAEKLEKTFGNEFAGAWLDDKQHLHVAVTDRSLAGDARVLGVTPAVVERSGAELDALMDRLDDAERPSPNQVAGWYVDVERNVVVVQALAGGKAAAQKFVGASGADRSAVEVETVSAAPQLYYDIIGGERYNLPSGWCSVGFSVQGGFVTAGHCGNVGTSTTGTNGVSQGTFQGSSFPTNDYAWVATNSNWTPTPQVTRYDGTTVTVEGSQEAAIGASICRSGGRTGWQCGSVEAKNQTVNYGGGNIVYGLTRTSACANSGDSGGSFISGSQAQGVTSGGTLGCPGGTTYFQPVNEILNAYNLTLVTGDGDPQPPQGCDEYGNVANGSLSGTGDYDIHPGGSYFYEGSSGTHAGCLSGPGSADFDLYLQKWSGSGWSTVASSLSPSSEETLTYGGTAGYYRYVAYSYSGSGSYTIGYSRP